MSCAWVTILVGLGALGCACQFIRGAATGMSFLKNQCTACKLRGEHVVTHRTEGPFLGKSAAGGLASAA